jgi:hypothetical protein
MTEEEAEAEGEEHGNNNSTRIITQITLDCLLNKEQYSKYLSSTLCKTRESSKRDRKFYKRRILQLTKDMLLSDEIDVRSDMIIAFDHYARTCISYFKMIDKTDILQTDYPPPTTESGIKVVAPFEDSCMSLMRSIKITPITMDNFVKRTSTVKEKPDIVTMIRDVNLKNPELRNKGIRKKKNVCPVYADAEQNGEKKNEEEEKED